MNANLETYFKAEKALSNAIKDIISNPQVIENIKKDFEKMYPGYYINRISSVADGIFASIYRKSDNKIVDGIGFPLPDRTWSFNH